MTRWLCLKFILLQSQTWRTSRRHDHPLVEMHPPLAAHKHPGTTTLE